jgi:hypothetical protein
MSPIEEKKNYTKPKVRWEPALRDETTKEKFARKAKKNPFVPIGRLTG